MAWRGLTPAEKNITTIVEAIRQLGQGRGDYSGKVSLSTGAIGTFTNLHGGTGYANGFYPDTPLTGGSGTGATANITVAGNAVTVVTLVEPGEDYIVGDILSAGSIPAAGAAGPIGTFSFAGGSGYTNGFYSGITLTYISGSFAGSGAVYDVTVTHGSVSSVVVTNPGTNFHINDVLGSTGLGSGTGFTFTVNGISGTGFDIEVATLAANASTLVQAVNCSKQCAVTVFPMNANAAGLWILAPLLPPYVDQADVNNGSFRITHPDPGVVDCVLGWIAVGG